MDNNKGSLKQKAVESFFTSYDNIIGSISFEAYDVALRQVMREVFEAGFMQGVRHGPPPIFLINPANVNQEPDSESRGHEDTYTAEDCGLYGIRGE